MSGLTPEKNIENELPNITGRIIHNKTSLRTNWPKRNMYNNVYQLKKYDNGKIQTWSSIQVGRHQSSIFVATNISNQMWRTGTYSDIRSRGEGGCKFCLLWGKNAKEKGKKVFFFKYLLFSCFPPLLSRFPPIFQYPSLFHIFPHPLKTLKNGEKFCRIWIALKSCFTISLFIKLSHKVQETNLLFGALYFTRTAPRDFKSGTLY